MSYGDVIAFALPTGPATIFPQTVAFALPGRAVLLQSTAVLELSVDGVTYTSVAATTTGTTTSAPYARCTVSTATVVAKAF